MSSPNKVEIIEWLKTILRKHDIHDIIVNTVTKPEEGDGYGSDMIFVNITGTNQKELTQPYDLVIKSTKSPQNVFRIAFKTESSVYAKVIPSFNQFLKEKKIDNLFNSVPKCYGYHLDDHVKIIVLENMKTNGYRMWNKQLPWIKENIEIVLQEYGKLHAISASMAKENPEKFWELTHDLGVGFGKVLEISGLLPHIAALIEEIYHLLIDDLNKEVLKKWLALKDQVPYIYTDLVQNIDGLKVITHGDCWSNNFLLKNSMESPVASAVSLVDWQISSLTSPILDLSYFLFACISKKNIKHLDGILDYYYENFSNYLRRLGSNPDLIYPKEQFLEDWKKYSKYGIVTCIMALKASHAEFIKEPFKFEFTNYGKAIFKERIVGIVEYVVAQGLI